jgi:hypothetical protein
MSFDELPAPVRRVLSRLRGVREVHRGWEACCPCPDHGIDGDQRPSLHITTGDDGRVLLRCRVGCNTDAVLDAAGLEWNDLFGTDDDAPAPPGPATPRAAVAGPVLTHRAYELLLAQLPLEDGHREDLRRRGLTDPEVDRRGYRSLRNACRGRAAGAVHRQLGDAVLGVPGFVRGRFGVTLDGASTGLLVPVRDVHGRIQALKVRRAGEPKYVYVTGGDGGTSPGAPVHVPLGVLAPAPIVRIVEGELKGDVVFALDGTPTVGVPGVALWRPALSVLRALCASTVILAYDAPDVHTKPPVFLQMEELWQALRADGFMVEVEDWYDDQLQGA